MYNHRWTTLHSLVTYGVLSTVFVVASDRLTASIVHDVNQYSTIQIIKNLTFLGLTLVFIAYLLHTERQRTRKFEAIARTSQERANLLFNNTTSSIWEEDFRAVRTALAKLRASGVKDLRSYLVTHPEVTWELARMVNVLDVNDRTLDIVKANKEDLLGSLDKSLSDETLPTFIDEMIAFDERKSHFEGEVTSHKICRDKNVFLLTMNIPPETGSFEHVLVTLTDITRLKRIEDELTHQKELLQTILDHIPMMVEFYDPDGNLQYVNQIWEQTTGWLLENAQGNHLLPVFFPETDERQRAKDFIDTPQPGWHDFQQVMQDGSRLNIAWSRTRLSDGTCVGLGQDVTVLRKAEKALRDSHEKLRALTIRLAEIEDIQRQLFAQELHDQVGQTLTAISVNINMIRSLLSESSEQVQYRLDDTQSLIEDANQKIRNVMADLHPQVLDDYGLPETLRWYGEKVQKRTGLQFSLDTYGPGCLPKTIEIALFRIFQEAVNNIIKHAEASNFQVRLHQNDDHIEFQVSDNGVGFDATEKTTGWGINIMQERTIAVGGELNIESIPERGTKITVFVPILEEKQPIPAYN